MRPLIQTLLAPLTWVSRKLGPAPEVHRDAETQAEVDRACEALALYQFWSCPYCVRVRREITRLALTIEIRDTRLDPEHRRALLEGGGKVQVPCLRIEEGGETRWLYESSDIIGYLRRRFGE
ncbi:glutaredoxin family protein [Halomonas elongata]|uniref:Glutaredoxin domain protein n=1 Tax=Halomonas elongata (strain ATCC 33173 / DSM 2581 / NBRC 15536 / NCIMB 2198 / 1H9) TaxID=768066 RepID=E1V596_HALED|nr:glutathione S-transferase N-terminal domain-containing protein [Halomonas elongata]MDL4863902.1 glutathione S-transferase N-terminal domain-containing protein [Halomonas elongata]WBF16791.1 glutathione S-transferase N-terminal domain-containing protein [Halomonas elongata]WPU45622.1 glutathione S-transferase N-terminal domain-containing protein [Halomonas elongata DSM 2581]WVI70467.1 glutathione S-transferase N-terminal domain-containing protein [Halomonas elongata]CBV43051.1 glutaredoxin d